MATTFGLRPWSLSRDRPQSCVSLSPRVGRLGAAPFTCVGMSYLDVSRIMFPIVAKTTTAVNNRLVSKCVFEINWENIVMEDMPNEI